jgi:hypothetical protein
VIILQYIYSLSPFHFSFVAAKIVANATVENDGDAYAEEHRCVDRCSCERRQVERISFNREQ